MNYSYSLKDFQNLLLNIQSKNRYQKKGICQILGDRLFVINILLQKYVNI